jgi:acyl carrier protein
METLDRLKLIFKEVFDDDVEISLEMTANDVEGWDSLTHVNLIVAIETRFNIKFSQKDLFSFNRVGDLLNCIDKKLANNG